MKKLYLFGDSFSLFDTDMQRIFSGDIEFNTHHSLSNEHILKLVKLKLLKLLDSNQRYDGANILIQFTVSSRICVLESSEPKTKISMNTFYSYQKHMIEYADKDIFENNYYTLYPHFESMNSELISMVFMPYLGFFITNNERNILKDLFLEVEILKNLANSIGINLEYFFYSNNFDRFLNKDDLISNHIKFEGHNSMESYIKENRQNYFVSKTDIHFNNNGNKWYLKWLKERYDI